MTWGVNFKNRLCYGRSTPVIFASWTALATAWLVGGHYDRPRWSKDSLTGHLESGSAVGRKGGTAGLRDRGVKQPMGGRRVTRCWGASTRCAL